MMTNKDYEFPLLDMDKYKDSLLGNLYSTIETLKKEMEEKNFIIRNLLQRRENVNKQHVSIESNSVETSPFLNINSHQFKDNSNSSVIIAESNVAAHDPNEEFIAPERNDIITIDPNPTGYTIVNKRHSIKSKHSNNTNFDIPLKNRFDSLDNGNDKNSCIKSTLYTNKHPEKDILSSKKTQKAEINYKRHTNVKRRKIAIISASITKPINMIEFNRLVKNGDAIKRHTGERQRHN